MKNESRFPFRPGKNVDNLRARLANIQSDLDNAARVVYDSNQKRFRPAAPGDDPNKTIDVTKADLGWGAGDE